jgi:hypothetical protein
MSGMYKEGSIWLRYVTSSLFGSMIWKSTQQTLVSLLGPKYLQYRDIPSERSEFNNCGTRFGIVVVLKIIIQFVSVQVLTPLDQLRNTHVYTGSARRYSTVTYTENKNKLN